MLRPEDIKLEGGVGHLSLDEDLDSQENKFISAPDGDRNIHTGVRELILSFRMTVCRDDDDHMIRRRTLEDLRQFTISAIGLLNDLERNSNGFSRLVVPITVRGSHSWFTGVNVEDFLTEFKSRHGVDSMGLATLNQIVQQDMIKLVADIICMMRCFLDSEELIQFPWPTNVSFAFPPY